MHSRVATAAMVAKRLTVMIQNLKMRPTLTHGLRTHLEARCPVQQLQHFIDGGVCGRRVLCLQALHHTLLQALAGQYPPVPQALQHHPDHFILQFCSRKKLVI